MKIHFFTIAYNAMPWITFHYPVMRRLSIDWEWHISEGPAAPNHDTAWCRALPQGASQDGTVEYLKTIAAFDPRVKLHQKEMWDGKREMCNVSLVDHIKEPTLVWEIDADEIWSMPKFVRMHKMFMDSWPEKNAAQFFCRCWMGPDIVITSRHTYGNHPEYEWRRVWVAEPGFGFMAHEPPAPNQECRWFSHEETENNGLVFDHYSYATPQQVRFKEHYYGYSGALAAWEKLQANDKWPVKLKDFLPWITDEATAERRVADTGGCTAEDMLGTERFLSRLARGGRDEGMGNVIAQFIGEPPTFNLIVDCVSGTTAGRGGSILEALRALKESLKAIGKP